MTSPVTHPTQAEQGPGETNIVKVVFASLIGTAVEWYDFFLYGSAAALVFGTLFFPESEPAAATMLAFGTYALGFVARPLGGIVFGHFGDRVGRKKMLVTSLLLMGVATFAIGLLPTYATIGIGAPILLLACRLVQGFAVGGEWGGAVLMAAEHGEDSRARLLVVVAAGRRGAGQPVRHRRAVAPRGLPVRRRVQRVGLAHPVPAQRRARHHRPVGAPLDRGVAGLQGGPRPSSSTSEKQHVPLFEVIKKYPREVLVAMGMRMAENISYYLFTVISITFLTTYVGTTGDKGIILKALLIGAVVHFVTIPLIGALSDRVGRRPLYIAGAVGVAAWSWIFFDLIASKSETKILLAVVVGLILHALMYAPQAAFFSELFGTSVRYTGASVGYQLASIFAGALAPIIAIKLLGPATNGAMNVDSVAIYMTIASVITLVAVFFAKETARSSLRHDRVLDKAHQ